MSFNALPAESSRTVTVKIWKNVKQVQYTYLVYFNQAKIRSVQETERLMFNQG